MTLHFTRVRDIAHETSWNLHFPLENTWAGGSPTDWGLKGHLEIRKSVCLISYQLCVDVAMAQNNAIFPVKTDRKNPSIWSFYQRTFGCYNYWNHRLISLQMLNQDVLMAFWGMHIPKSQLFWMGFVSWEKIRPRIFQDAQRQHQAIIESVTGQPCYAVLLLVRLRGVTGFHFLY